VSYAKGCTFCEASRAFVDDDIDDCLILEECVNQIGAVVNIEFRHNVKAALGFLDENKTNLAKVFVIDVNLPVWMV
jgi:hypothetical protein